MRITTGKATIEVVQACRDRYLLLKVKLNADGLSPYSSISLPNQIMGMGKVVYDIFDESYAVSGKFKRW